MSERSKAHIYARKDRPRWLGGAAYLDRGQVHAKVEWSVLSKHGFGVGFRLGHNGSESDVGLDIHLTRLASVWLRLQSPWTARLRRTKANENDRDWYKARHYSIHLLPRRNCYLSGEWRAFEGEWSSEAPWYRDWSITDTTILGRKKTTYLDGDKGETVVPLPEGSYAATWEQKRFEQRYVRWPGKLIDLIRGVRPHEYINLDIPGGIPVEGKGENSYDCGMDGLFGCSGQSVEDAVANAVKSVLRDRKRYGGPHDLPRPMSVTEAGRQS